MHGGLLNVLESFYDGNKSLCGGKTVSIELSGGVYHRSIMSPRLCSIFMDGALHEVSVTLGDYSVLLSHVGTMKVHRCCMQMMLFCVMTQEVERDRMVGLFDVYMRRTFKVNSNKEKDCLLQCSVSLDGKELVD